MVYVIGLPEETINSAPLDGKHLIFDRFCGIVFTLFRDFSCHTPTNELRKITSFRPSIYLYEGENLCLVL